MWRSEKLGEEESLGKYKKKYKMEERKSLKSPTFMTACGLEVMSSPCGLTLMMCFLQAEEEARRNRLMRDMAQLRLQV